MAYFLRAKSQFQCKMGPGFIHNFQEMTYLKPTFCEHCAGFVSMILITAYLKNNFLAFNVYGVELAPYIAGVSWPNNISWHSKAKNIYSCCSCAIQFWFSSFWKLAFVRISVEGNKITLAKGS